MLQKCLAAVVVGGAVFICGAIVLAENIRKRGQDEVLYNGNVVKGSVMVSSSTLTQDDLRDAESREKRSNPYK